MSWRCAIDFIEEIVRQLRDKTGLSVLYHEVPTWVKPAPGLPPSTPDNQAKALSDSDSRNDEDPTTVIYIGEESLALTNLLMTHSSSHVSLVGWIIWMLAYD